MSLTKRTIAYSNPPASCLSPRLKSTGKNLGETEVFNAVRRGFTEVKLQIKTAIRPRQNRGKWSHSFERYCIFIMLLSFKDCFLLFSGHILQEKLKFLHSDAHARCKQSNCDNVACFCILSLVIVGTRKDYLQVFSKPGIGKFMFLNSLKIKNWFMLSMHILSYGCTQEVKRAQKKRNSCFRCSQVQL